MRKKFFPTKNEYAYDQIKKSIVSGVFRPGDRLIIDKLSKTLGVSNIPVREAISRLSTEELVVNTPHVGPVVSTFSLDNLKENYLIRSELEGLATLHAAEYLTERDFRMLQQNIDCMRDAIDKGDVSKIGLINKEFHLIIYKACPYKKVYRLIVDLWNNIDRLQSVFALVPSRATLSLQEHIEILNALKRKDGPFSRLLVEKQKKLAWKDLESYYNSKRLVKLV